ADLAALEALYVCHSFEGLPQPIARPPWLSSRAAPASDLGMGCSEAILQCITKFSGKASASSSVKSASISHRPQLFLQGGDAIGIRRVGREKFDRLAPLLLLSHGLPESKCRPRVIAGGGGKAQA